VIDTIVQGLLALVALVALLWGARGRQRAREEGAQDAADEIGERILNTDTETRERVRQELARRPGRGDAAERLRHRLERSRTGGR